jgi:hypothetical protein
MLYSSFRLIIDYHISLTTVPFLPLPSLPSSLSLACSIFIYVEIFSRFLFSFKVDMFKDYFFIPYYL